MKQITGQVIYLGPQVQSLGLYFHKGYVNGVEPQLYPWFEQCPALRELIVPVAETGGVMRELNFDYAHNMRGTRGKYVTFYQAVQQWLAQKKSPAPSSGITLKQHS